MGETRIAGLLDADFSQGDARLAYESTVTNIDIGQLLRDLEIRDDIEARAGRAELAVSTRGESLRELAENAQLDARLYEYDSVLDLPGVAREFDRGFDRIRPLHG